MRSDFNKQYYPSLQVSWFNNNQILQKQSSISDQFSVGRSSDNTIVIVSPSVSRHHFEVKWENGAWWIEDKQSANGTYVNQNLIKQRSLLDLPATVTLGNSDILLKIEAIQPHLNQEQIQHLHR